MSDWLDELYKEVEKVEEEKPEEVEVEEPAEEPKAAPTPRKAKKFPKYWDIVAWINENPDKVTEKTLRKNPEKWKGIVQTILAIAEEIYLG